MGIFKFLIAIVLAFVCMHLVAKDIEYDFEALHLQKRDRVLYSPGIHCRDTRDADPCFHGTRTRGKETIGLLLGNSQLHHINDYRTGEKTAPYIVHNLLIDKDVDIIGLSVPQMNPQEMLVLYEYSLTKIHPDILILGLVFPNFGVYGVRKSVTDAFTIPTVAKAMSGSPAGRQILAEYIASKNSGDPTLSRYRERLDGLVSDNFETTQIESFQTRLESALDIALLDFELWRSRRKMKGLISVAIWNTRNSLLGMKLTVPHGDEQKSTKRARMYLDKAAYSINMRSLSRLYQRASQNGTRVLTYFAPMPTATFDLYSAAENEKLIIEVKKLAKQCSCPVADFSHVVPDEHFLKGVHKDGSKHYDIFHFNGEAHKNLAKNVAPYITSMISH